jgi:hypothetical protein
VKTMRRSEKINFMISLINQQAKEENQEFISLDYYYDNKLKNYILHNTTGADPVTDEPHFETLITGSEAELIIFLKGWLACLNRW